MQENINKMIIVNSNEHIVKKLIVRTGNWLSYLHLDIQPGYYFWQSKLDPMSFQEWFIFLHSLGKLWVTLDIVPKLEEM